MNEIENRALGPIVHAQTLVGLENLIIFASGRGKPCELHVVLNSALSRCSLDLVAREANNKSKTLPDYWSTGRSNQCSKHQTLANQDYTLSLTGPL